jgi:hypothetical protein
MTMAGPTAVRMNPRAYPSSQGMPKTGWATVPDTKASQIVGIISRRTNSGPINLKACARGAKNLKKLGWVGESQHVG